MKHADLSVVVVSELLQGRVIETHLEADGMVMFGACHEGKVFVDPVPSTLDTAIHECLHRAFPTWSERKVRTETDQFVRAMTPAERRKMFALYKRVAKKRKGVVKVKL